MSKSTTKRSFEMEEKTKVYVCVGCKAWSYVENKRCPDCDSVLMIAETPKGKYKFFKPDYSDLTNTEASELAGQPTYFRKRKRR